MATASRSGSPSEVLKRLLVGRALATHKQEHQLLPKSLALPVFASDQLSSVAYATEQMMLILLSAGVGALSAMVPLGLGIAVLLAIVITSYRQTARAYPRGGGSYIVARENLGTVPGLVAAAAIQTSYVLTVAVSVTAGTIAVTSAAPRLAPYKVAMAISFVALITLANLRGVKEAGRLFAMPTYGFVAMVFFTLGIGFARCVTECPEAATSDLEIEAVSGLGAFILLRAFSSGATALTGVEAIADGVQAFRRPQARNAAATLAIMGAMSIPMFLGITVLAGALEVRVNEKIAVSKSVLAQIGETVYGSGPMFWLLQVFTAGILVLAANTAYQDFPRLSSILARDRFMPSQFRNRGDRLVFSNGIIFLAVLSSALIWLFDAELTRLIHMYVVGVFTALTLSQAGMVKRWLTLKGEGWGRNLVINGVGAAATGAVLAVIAVTQFTLGAWIVVATVPVIVAFFLAVHHHYVRVGAALRAGHYTAKHEARNAFVVLVRDLGPATADAVAYLRAIRPERVRPLWVGPAEEYRSAAVEWTVRCPRLGELELLPAGDEHLVRELRRYLHEIERDPGDFVTVIVPEVLSGRSWLQFLRNRSALLVKTSLLFEEGIVVTDVPLLPEERVAAEAHAERPVEPERIVALVPVSGIHDATVLAVVYAKSLNPAAVEGLFFVTDPEEVDPIIEGWHDRQMDVPLTLVEAPFRDLGDPLLAEIRKHTERRDTIVTVVLPELIPAHWWENLLHNQTAFYIKRLLLFEPNVVVTSVPVHVRTATPASTSS